LLQSRKDVEGPQHSPCGSRSVSACWPRSIYKGKAVNRAKPPHPVRVADGQAPSSGLSLKVLRHCCFG